jgi:GTP 3',8-cyclase
MKASLALLPNASVLDSLARPLHDLRISVIETCNFRCPYCMPEGSVDDAALASKQRLSFDQITALARAFVANGVSKIRLTGGEPLLRRNLPHLIAQLKQLDGLHDLALTTNGSLLASQAMALRAAGLDRLTVSVDALEPTLFKRMSGGRGELSQVLEGIAAAERAGFGSLKINCVVQRGINDHQIWPLLDFFRARGHVVRFIEYMDVGNCNAWQREQVFSVQEMHARIAERETLRACVPTAAGEVAERYVLSGGGEVGFIASVSKPFCGDCNRARISVEGKLFTCLFASGGFNLQPYLSDDQRLIDEIRSIWRHRGDRYSEIRHAAASDRKKIEMYFIGG